MIEITDEMCMVLSEALDVSVLDPDTCAVGFKVSDALTAVAPLIAAQVREQMSKIKELRVTVGEHDECYHDSISDALTDHDGYLVGAVEPFTILTVARQGWLVVTDLSGGNRIFDTQAEAEAFAATMKEEEE